MLKRSANLGNPSNNSRLKLHCTQGVRSKDERYLQGFLTTKSLCVDENKPHHYKLHAELCFIVSLPNTCMSQAVPALNVLPV